MQQRDQTILQVVTPSDKSPVQNELDVEKKVSVNHECQNKLADYEEQLEKPTFFNRFGGMLMALCASVFFSISFLIVKVLNKHGFKAFGCSVLFNTGVLVPCFIGILLHEKGPRAEKRPRIFEEIWPLSISSKNTTLKILLVSTRFSDH